MNVRWCDYSEDISTFASLMLAQAASPSPVFGSASTFGAGTGFGGFKGVSTAASSRQAEKPEDDTPPEEGTGETEEECQAEFRPIVQLEEVERVSGEEGEETLADLYALPLCMLAKMAIIDTQVLHTCRFAQALQLQTYNDLKRQSYEKSLVYLYFRLVA